METTKKQEQGTISQTLLFSMMMVAGIVLILISAVIYLSDMIGKPLPSHMLPAGIYATNCGVIHRENGKCYQNPRWDISITCFVSNRKGSHWITADLTKQSFVDYQPDSNDLRVLKFAVKNNVSYFGTWIFLKLKTGEIRLYEFDNGVA